MFGSTGHFQMELGMRKESTKFVKISQVIGSPSFMCTHLWKKSKKDVNFAEKKPKGLFLNKFLWRVLTDHRSLFVGLYLKLISSLQFGTMNFQYLKPLRQSTEKVTGTKSLNCFYQSVKLVKEKNKRKEKTSLW
eukprot:Lithocolla_globosa_v1_NODE_8199_length_851_cov_2.770101.p2 type:complete len:134 gc:universal NODE_8199_length_851_cov_2.770101:476-75(-)